MTNYNDFDDANYYDDNYDDYEQDDDPEFNANLCTCKHTQEKHGCEGCLEENCECEAHWEE